MLDRLPPEILDAILVLSYPPSPWPDEDDVDKERRQSLTKLSLVCKAVSAVAQDLLWRKLSFESDDDLELTRRLQKLETPLRAKVRTVRTKKRAALQEMLVVVPQCPGVKKLQCTDGRTTLEQLSSFPTLRTIELFSLEIWPEPSLNPLSLQPFNLVHLSLLAVYVFQQDDFDRLLQPDVLPNLLTLWIGHCGYHHALRGYVPLVSSNLAKQLDMIQISLRYRPGGDEPPSPSFWTLPTAILVTHVLSPPGVLPKPLPTLPSHVRIVVDPDSGAKSDTLVSKNLDSLASCITPLISLRTLVLPSFLRRLDHSMPASVSKRDDLLKTCTAKKVDVVWHDEEAELSFSKAFWAYAKRLKAAALETGEAAQEASVTV
ncbi:hypothetical protein JCM8097_005690 [Rhodosporidiobolus ruineniae]